MLATKLASLSWDSPAAGALQLEPGGTVGAVTGGAATFQGMETLLSYASPSVAVTVTTSSSLKRAVPVIAPVDGLMDSPPGSPVALIGRLTAEPTAVAWGAGAARLTVSGPTGLASVRVPVRGRLADESPTPMA